MKSADIQNVSTLEEIEGDDDVKLVCGWDAINVN